ncbi:TerC family protein [Clostridium oryzae]|uniref:Integral membrane protein TerC family protein n=1 Tax=Clostridium oryzae TaxID=1450648 RepID=A0A1V4IHE2_9CLOT|nr:TerC family protein [Clostridium oryzae]OPJ59234.1 integral membrane protein TerC family protein [Clostridium oryzae]
MDKILYLIMSILQITLLDIVLSGDNVSVIALAIRKLPEKKAKIASLIGISGAVTMRILFSCIITLIMQIQWLPVKLIGGLLLIKITWDLTYNQEEEEKGNVDSNKTLWKAAFTIIIADVSMSLDNVIAIAAAAKGNVWLIIFGIMMSVPIIFLGSSYVAKLMKKYKIIIYVGGSLLAYTAVNMITDDKFVACYLNSQISTILPFIFGLIVILYGLYDVKKVGNSYK